MSRLSVSLVSANISLSLPARQQGKVDSFEELIYLYTPHCLAHSGFSLGPLSPETSTLKISCSRNSRDRIFSGFEGRSFHDSNRTGSWNIRHRLLVVWSKGHHGTGLGNTRFSPASSKIKVQWKQDLNQPLAADTSGNGVAGRSENAEKREPCGEARRIFQLAPREGVLLNGKMIVFLWHGVSRITRRTGQKMSFIIQGQNRQVIPALLCLVNF